MKTKIVFSNPNPNTVLNSDMEFEISGGWEKKHGRRHTRIYAEMFNAHFTIPKSGNVRLLDMGCALGDAVPVLKRKYPSYSIFGCDFSQIAVDRANRDYCKYGVFFKSSIDSLEEYFDVIYCSNVMEHIENSDDIVLELISSYCQILYLLVPYNELRDGRSLTPGDGSFHVRTFTESSFDWLEDRGCAVRYRIAPARGAWSETLLRETAKRILRPDYVPRRQIVYEIVRINTER